MSILAGTELSDKAWLAYAKLLIEMQGRRLGGDPTYIQIKYALNNLHLVADESVLTELTDRYCAIEMKLWVS